MFVFAYRLIHMTLVKVLPGVEGDGTEGGTGRLVTLVL